MTDVLLIDDDGDLLHSLARALSPKISPLTITGVSSAERAREAFRAHPPKVVVLDLCLDEKVGVESGFSLLGELHELDVASRILVLTGHGSSGHGVRAIGLGAASFLEKPADPAHLAAIVKDSATQADLRRMHDSLSRRMHAQKLDLFVGSGRAASVTRDEIAFAARTRLPVLLLGETGTGKGLCARLIHEMSDVRDGPFVHYQPNFGGGDLVQSELFGHVRGAFTGAHEARFGLAREAHRGTLFIDEIDEMPSNVQVRLLDLVQERRVRPVGADVYHDVECRFIAATNADVETALTTGKLRRDLYHRLAHSIIRIPPLRERVEDIPELCAAALRRVRERYGITVLRIEDPVIEILSQRAWPGNVRELNAVVEGAAYRAHNDERTAITASDLRFANSHQEAPGVIGGGQKLHERVADLKRRMILEAVQQSQGNQLQAAKILGVDRGTLRRMLNRVVS